MPNPESEHNIQVLEKDSHFPDKKGFANTTIKLRGTQSAILHRAVAYSTERGSTAEEIDILTEALQAPVGTTTHLYIGGAEINLTRFGNGFNARFEGVNQKCYVEYHSREEIAHVAAGPKTQK